MSNSFQCGQLEYSLDLRSVFSMSTGQKLAITIVGPITLLFSVFDIIALLSFKPLRQPPADILLFITVFSILKIIILFATITYDNFYPPNEPVPDSYNNFCMGTGLLDVVAEMSKIVYTLVFCLYYITKIRNPLKAWISQNKEIHFLCGFLIFLITFILYLTNSIGLSMYGSCGIRFSPYSDFATAGTGVAYMIVLLLSSFIFLKYIRKNSQSNAVIGKFFKYYCCFLAIFCINQVLLTLSHFITAISCRNQNSKYTFNSFRLITNVCSLLSPLFVFAILITNPYFKKAMIIKVMRKLHNKYENWQKERKKKKNASINQERSSFYDQLITTNRNSILIQLNNLGNLDYGYLSDFKDKNRACFLATLLGCLTIYHLQQKNYRGSLMKNINLRTSAVEQDCNSLFKWSYSQTCCFTLTNLVVQYYSHVFISKLPTVSIKFISYAPSIFKQFMEMNKVYQIGSSLSPINNQKSIMKDSQNNGDGGRSGQFFFFNFDKTLILKTISQRERTVFLERLQKFHQYFCQHPNSLIVKLFTIFTALNTDTKQQINFTLMGNILRRINKKYLIRAYDLKGSFHSRQVLKHVENVPEIVADTLKDIDFLRLQEKIFINSDQAATLKKIISQDSKFLSGLGLIDYSLIVMKINLSLVVQEHEDYQEILKNVVYYKSLKQTGVAYVFGIIDYLQTWNIRKKGEKWYKSLFTKTEEISSQNPKFYSERYVYFCHDIFSQ